MAEIVIVEEQNDDINECKELLTALDGKRLRVLIPYKAFATLSSIYGLSADDEVIHAALREHATRILGLPDDNHNDPRVAKRGGLRKDVAIRRGTQADLPPAPVPTPSPAEQAASIIEKANTLAEVKAALAAWLRTRR